MSKKIQQEEFFEAIDDDEEFDYLEKIYHRRNSTKRRNEARRKLETMQESRELDRLMRDDIYDWE